MLTAFYLSRARRMHACIYGPLSMGRCPSDIDPVSRYMPARTRLHAPAAPVLHHGCSGALRQAVVLALPRMHAPHVAGHTRREVLNISRSHPGWAAQCNAMLCCAVMCSAVLCCDGIGECTPWLTPERDIPACTPPLQPQNTQARHPSAGSCVYARLWLL